MSPCQFNESQSSALAAHFLSELTQICKGRFLPSDFEALLKGVGFVFQDPLYPEIWNETYQDTFGKTLCSQSCLTKEEVFTNLIELCLRFVFEWDLDVSETVRLLFNMRFHPEKHVQEVALWERLCAEPLKEITYHTKISFFKFHQPPRKITLNYPDFSEYGAFSLAHRFLDSLWQTCRHFFSQDGAEEFACVVSDFDGEPAAPADWATAYRRSCGKIFTDETLLTEQEVFTCMIDYVGQYWYGWTLNLQETLNLLLLMRHKQEAYAFQHNLWEEEKYKIKTNYYRYR